MENWLEKQDNMDVQYISYNDIIGEPLPNAQILSRFLGDRSDVNKMVKIIARALYRQRNKS